MPLQLTTSIDVGDLDTHDYTHVKVVHFALDVRHGAIQFQTSEGYLVGAQFQRGAHSRDRSWEIRDIPAQGIEGEAEYVAADPQFSTMVGTQGEDDQLLYDGVAGALYDWLVAKGHYSGTIT